LILIFTLEFLDNPKIITFFRLMILVAPILLLIVIANILFFNSGVKLNPIFNGIVKNLIDLPKNWFLYLNIIDFISFIFIIITFFVLLRPIIYKIYVDLKGRKVKLLTVFRKNKYLIASIMMFFAYLCFPVSLGGETWYLNSRFIPYFILLGLLSVNSRISKIQKNLIIIIILVLSIISVLNVAAYFYQQNGVLKTYLSGIDSISTNSSVLPLYYGKWGRINPLNHAWAYYHIEKGGIGPYFFAKAKHFPVEYKIDPNSTYLPSPDEYNPSNLSQDILESYNYIIIWDQLNYEYQNLSNLNFDLEFTNGKLRIYKKAQIDKFNNHHKNSVII